MGARTMKRVKQAAEIEVLGCFGWVGEWGILKLLNSDGSGDY